MLAGIKHFKRISPLANSVLTEQVAKMFVPSGVLKNKFTLMGDDTALFVNETFIIRASSIENAPSLVFVITSILLMATNSLPDIGLSGSKYFFEIGENAIKYLLTTFCILLAKESSPFTNRMPELQRLLTAVKLWLTNKTVRPSLLLISPILPKHFF